MNITTFIIVSVIKTVLALFVLLTAVAYTVWLERKVVGHMQNRWGPTRVGPFGLLQPLADGVKFLFKEDLTPPHVYKPLVHRGADDCRGLCPDFDCGDSDRQLDHDRAAWSFRCRLPTSTSAC